MISIIVPVYNAKDYLRRCLDSILAQTYTDWEAVLIDDGSTDESGKICDEYASKDNRFKVFHRENKGVSAVRNAGLASASGEYIAFIDSDDFVHKDMLKCQYQMLKDNNADLAITGYGFAYDNTVANVSVNEKLQVLDSEGAINKILENQQFCSPWTKLYKKKLFENVKYPEGEIYEDLMTAFEIFMAAKIIVYQNIPFYNYFQACESITRSEFNYSKLDEVKALKKQYEFVNANFPKLANEARFKYVNNVFGHIINLVTKEDETGVAKYQEFTTVLKENYSFYKVNSQLSKKNKFRLALMKYPKLYKGFYKITGKN